MTKRQKKWFIQKPIGVLMLIISYFLIKLTSTGLTPEDRDVSFVLVTIPMGLSCLFSRHYLFQ